MQVSDMILVVYIISRKMSIASVNRAGGVWGCSETPAEVLRWDNNLLGSKEHLDWLKIYLNVAEIITVQDYKHTKKLM